MSKPYGVELKRLRVEAGMSQRVLAERIGCGFPHISKVERGHERPSAEFIMNAQQALGGHLKYLLLLAGRCGHCGGFPEVAPDKLK